MKHSVNKKNSYGEIQLHETLYSNPAILFTFDDDGYLLSMSMIISRMVLTFWTMGV